VEVSAAPPPGRITFSTALGPQLCSEAGGEVMHYRESEDPGRQSDGLGELQKQLDQRMDSTPAERCSFHLRLLLCKKPLSISHDG
jgi:hypothetical protein